VNHEGKGLQQASSYIAGLTPTPYWDVHGGSFPWLEELEKNYQVIRDELLEGLKNPDLERVGNAIWVAAARDDAEGYGPDWRTLVLQDRCIWEPTNVSLFPKTAAVVKVANTPSVEVFFAKQAPQTGIKPHTDFTNFIMTSHLGRGVALYSCCIRFGW
jgi:aspartyl/asparaginyl beta-hydroxylase (cupin superfamily)